MNALARLAVLGTFPFVVSVSACSSQQEGERCDQPADCETGLTCQAFPGVLSYSVCCPVSGLSSVASCNPGTAPPPEPSDAGDAGDAGDASDANDATTSEEAATPDASAEADASEDGGAD
jgi:hypothetical protein